MAGSNLRSPAERATVAFGELMQRGAEATMLDFAAKVAVVIALFCFIFLLGEIQFQSKKGSTTLESASHVLLSAQSSGVHKKKKATRAKKGKKVQVAASTKFASELETISEGESEVGRKLSSSDLEAPSMPLIQVEASQLPLEADEPEAESEGDDVDMRTEEDTDTVICVEDVTTPECTDTAAASATASEVEVDTVCQECQKLTENSWGCSAHRVYSSSLLLMHGQMRVAIARGPPGLEAPAGPAPPTNGGMCCTRAA